MLVFVIDAIFVNVYRVGLFHSPVAFCEGNGDFANRFMYADRQFYEWLCLVALDRFCAAANANLLAYRCTLEYRTRAKPDPYRNPKPNAKP